MKRLIILLLMIQMSLIGHTAIYYVSSTDGSDSDSGLTESLAWQTLTKLNAFTFASGDQILFRKGDTFYGSITVPRSTLAFGAYGTGSNPIISGFETVSGWTDQGNGIYRASTTASNTCNMVTVNGVNTPKGRYPKTGWLTFESFVNRTSITDNQLTNSPNWTGAEVVMVVDKWTIDRSLITNHTNSTINYTAGGSHSFEASGGYKYFIQNDLKTLTALGDWYCDGTYMYMYFGANNPSSYVVKAAKIENLITLNLKNTITISNLTIEGSNTYGMFFSVCSGISITNCAIKSIGHTGIFGYGSNTISVDNCSINNNNNAGIDIDAASTSISNCEVDSSGVHSGMLPYSGGSSLAMGIKVRSTGGLIEYCRVTNSGYNAISYYNSGFIVRYNVIDGCNYLLTDGGAIYTWLNDPTIIWSGVKVYNNIILNSNANGLYCDNATNGIELYNNTIVSCAKWGFHSNDIFNVSLHHNTFYKSALAGFQLSTTNTVSGYTHNDTITNNVIVNSPLPNAVIYEYSSNTNDIINFIGTSDYNTLIGSSSNTNDFLNWFTTPGWSYTRRSFAGWKTLTSKEANSTYTSIDLGSDDVIIEYNTTSIEKTVILDQNYRDIVNNADHTSVILEPYTSMVLLKHSAYPSTSTRKSVSNNKKTIVYNGKAIRN